MLTPPSPSSSPSLTAQDTTNSRKRQRSQSMQSEASSSSPKRSASLDPQSLQANDAPAALTPAASNREIDSYMTEQGEDHGQAVPSLTGVGWSAAQKLEFVENAVKKSMQVGETWYIVSRRWYSRWRKAMTGEEDKEGRVEETDVGPVDNTPLCDQRGQVTSELIEHVDCEFVPEEVWAKLQEWYVLIFVIVTSFFHRYGKPKYPLARKVIARGISQEPTLELRPPTFKVHLLTPASLPGQTVPPKDVTVSSTDKIRDVRRIFAHAVSPSKAAAAQYRVWKITPEASTDQLFFAIDTLRTCGAALLQDDDSTVGDELVDSSEVFVVEFMNRNAWSIDPAAVTPLSNGTSVSSAPPPPPPPPPTQPGPLFNSGADFFTQLQHKTGSTPSTTTIAPSSVFKPNSVTAKSNSSVRSKVQHEPGTLGLGNMGNTCFMNSALQCLAHTQELMNYFLAGVYEEELNPDNPLGMHGAVAQAFGALMSRIWDPESSMSSYTPREFKQTLQRFAPQFSGYQQHDSQELVAFLLDGLHEDLNRVLQKPYVEKPDWEGGGDKELVELANTSWEGYMKRNDSVVVDLFQGQYQSTLVCPECEKVSITFDPFMYLTLPLPVQKKWQHTILYIPWDLQKPHVRVPVELNRHSSFKDLRQLLGRWMGANPDNLLTLEIFNHQFYKNLDDTIVCEDLSDNDTIVCFELPCNSQQSRTYKPKPDDPFIVPIFPCESTLSRSSFRTGPSLFGYPFFAVIDQEQAKNPEIMYDLVTERLQRWTVHARDLFTWEEGPRDEMEPVHIPITSPHVTDSVTEIKENGEVVTVQEDIPEEGDIVDEKASMVRDADEDEDDDMGLNGNGGVPRRVGFKRDLFTIKLQRSGSPYGVGYNTFSNNHSRFETWEQRAASDKEGLLLRPDDVFFIEFDEGVKAYYFGDERNHYEYALWNRWDEFVHPELTASLQVASTKKQRGITLQDCLDEFTKEEQLGEDDLWYCPRCKKHQQATKRFDLWKVPDVLVVHLKRFSNSRMLRDKIDTFVDFPIEGLDLTNMVGERLVGKRLAEQGVDVEALGLKDLEEPLVYDLFAVDEHLGGLGGGHYRAYAMNHVTGKWYHFDDSYVTPSRPEAAVNANAYLLFYRRRTSRPLGGKSHIKIEEARAHARAQLEAASQEDIQLPTPPSDDSFSRGEPSVASNPPTILDWPTPDSMSRSSPTSSPLPLDDRLPSFDEALFDPVMQSSLNDIPLGATQLELPDPLSRGSPSSIDAEPDLEENDDTDSPFYQPDREQYDPGQDFSPDAMRLRHAVFRRAGSQDVDGDGEVDEDGTDVMMTPAESELDETESAGFDAAEDVPAKGA
ncbi:cysteine proteinase [Trametes elegans]|nr:cysteine proteinase [Trametes elegans]